MKTPTTPRSMACLLALVMIWIALPREGVAQDLGNGLVSYWPMESVQGTKTPDLVSGYDMDLSNLTTNDLVPGVRGTAFSFVNARQTLLSRVHGANDQLPITKHPAYTVSMWTKVNGTGQNDLRMFSEGNRTNTGPLFNLGTHSTGLNGELDVFIRQDAPFPAVGGVAHIRTTAEPLDDTWHHIVFVQETDGSRKVYIDGAEDPIPLPPNPGAALVVNDTSIGGILRVSPGSWVTGLIDEVALWRRALTSAEVTKLKNEGLTSVFPPLAVDLVSHWPMETVQGSKTPDLVNGYDMDLSNLTTNDLVAGIRGTAFSFVNARQTLLSRVHGANDQLPITKHPAYTVSMWTKVNGTGQNDLRMFSEGNRTNTGPLFNLGTHSTGLNGELDVFIRQDAPFPAVGGVAHIRTTAEPLDDTWHHIVFVQETDGSRKVYIDGAEDPIPLPPNPGAALVVNDTSIGGILRVSPGSWVTGVIDEVALWKRALTLDEVNAVKTNGVPTVFKRQLPLEIKQFSADFSAVAQGDKIRLRWDANADASLSISPGIGSVDAQTQFGAGSIEVAVSNATTFTLTATRGSETVTADVSVGVVPDVAANWRLIDNLNTYAAGGLVGKGNWLNPEGVFSVADFSGNKVVGYSDGNALAALPLNSLTVREGQKATLFFRVYVSTNEPETGLVVTFGLTEAGIRFNGDFDDNVGPHLRLERPAGGGTVDLSARNDVPGAYDVVADAVQPGSVYRIWLDVENKPFDVQGGVQMGGDVYSVYIQKEGDANRTVLFQDYLSDRDAANIDPFFGAPGTNLTHLFLSAIGAGQGTDLVRFDDFFLSSNGFNLTTPVAASAFEQGTGPSQIRISAFAYNTTTFTVTWESLPGTSYTIQRKNNLNDASWVNVATGYPAGGATGPATSYTDNVAGQTAGFYRVIFTP